MKIRCSLLAVGNATGLDFSIVSHGACCMSASALPSPFKLVCATVLTLLIVFALMMKLFSKFTTKKPLDPEEYVPTLDVRNEAVTIDIFDYLEQKKTGEPYW